MPTHQHVAVQGECLLSIAAKEGFLWKQIWDFEGNRKLRELRKEPNLLAPGDVVQIPEKKVASFQCEAGKVHRFVVHGRRVEVRVRLLHLEGPRRDEPYHVEVAGVIYKGKTERTNDDGLAICRIPATAHRAILVVGELEDEYELLIGDMDPHDTVSGAHARLENLGFDTGGVGSPWDGKSASALRSFFAEYKSGEVPPPNAAEEIDERSRQALVDEYGA
jgi:N-acetylmuramoyl-L-alanine amidase